MSKIALEGNSLGSGTFTIAAPNSNSNPTLTLPTSSGTVVVTGGAQTIEFAAGTAASPSITFTGDTNTGIFSPGADTIAFSEGGVESMRIDSSGDLALGRTSVTAIGSGYRTIDMDGANGSGIRFRSNGTQVGFLYSGGTSTLDLGTGGAYPITFTTNANERMRIDSSGNVGIGVTPSAALDIQRTSAVTQLILRNTGSASANKYTTLFQGSSSTGLAAWDESGVLEATSTGGLYLGAYDGPIRFYSGSQARTERARITSGGDLLVGTTSSVSSLADGNASTNGMGYRNNSTGCWLALQNEAASCFYASKKTGYTDSRFMQFSVNATGVGSITTNGTNTTYVTTSDYRLKENIAPMEGALAKVSQLKPVTYTWKLNDSAGQGFIAHELQEVCPDAVVGEKDAIEIYIDDEGNEQTRPVYQGVDTSFLVATLTAAIQDLKAITDAQATRIEALEAEVAALKGQ